MNLSRISPVYIRNLLFPGGMGGRLRVVPLKLHTMGRVTTILEVRIPNELSILILNRLHNHFTGFWRDAKICLGYDSKLARI
jgi:hypothetical protein